MLEFVLWLYLYNFICLVVILGTAIIFMEKNKLNFHRIAIFAIFYILYLSIRFFSNYVQFLHYTVPFGSWLLGVVAGIICFIVFRKYFVFNYFTIKQDKNILNDKKQIRLIAIVSIITFIGIAIIFLTRGQSLEFSIEELLFYSLVVNIHEEIIFRGILLVLLIGCLDKKILFIKYPAVLLCGIFFSFYHHHFFYFDIINIITNCIFGYVVGWIAIKTRSIFIPIILHSSVNFIGYLIQVFLK